MVAYSFRPRFAPLIVDGLKSQTIRSRRDRHARPGERLQLFTGMRTRQCRKIIDDPVCTAVEPIRILVGRDRILEITIPGNSLTLPEMEMFAIADGFESLDDMHGFWFDEHGEGYFHGVVIMWNRKLSGDLP